MNTRYQVSVFGGNGLYWIIQTRKKQAGCQDFQKYKYIKIKLLLSTDLTRGLDWILSDSNNLK